MITVEKQGIDGFVLSYGLHQQGIGRHLVHRTRGNGLGSTGKIYFYHYSENPLL